MKYSLTTTWLLVVVALQAYPAKAASDPGNMPMLADKLEKCETYSEKFRHPFTGEILERKITSSGNDICNYTEEMPNGEKMECGYSLNSRMSVAQHYRDLGKVNNLKVETNTTLSGSGKTKSISSIDGKIVKKNALQEFIDNGECIVSRYSGADEPKSKHIFADKLESCEPYAEKSKESLGRPFKDSFAEGIIERKIIGTIKDKCLVIQEMSDSNRMECRYSIESRKAIAQSYREYANAKSKSMEEKMNDGKKEVIYRLDNKEVNNPAQEAMDKGECIVFEPPKPDTTTKTPGDRIIFKKTTK